MQVLYTNTPPFFKSCTACNTHTQSHYMYYIVIQTNDPITIQIHNRCQLSSPDTALCYYVHTLCVQEMGSRMHICNPGLKQYPTGNGLGTDEKANCTIYWQLLHLTHTQARGCVFRVYGPFSSAQWSRTRYRFVFVCFLTPMAICMARNV